MAQEQSTTTTTNIPTEAAQDSAEPARPQPPSIAVSPTQARPTLPASTYPYIATSPDLSSKTSLATTASAVPAHLPTQSHRPHHSDTTGFLSYTYTAERARLLRSSRKLGRLLGATPVVLSVLQDADEEEAESESGMGANGDDSNGGRGFSLSTSDLHSISSHTTTATSNTTTTTATGGVGGMRGFVLAMKALEGDVFLGKKSGRSSSPKIKTPRGLGKGKENKEREKRVKALQLEEERERERREKEIGLGKKMKRMSAPPTPTSFVLPSPPATTTANKTSFNPDADELGRTMGTTSTSTPRKSGEALRSETKSSTLPSASKKSIDISSPSALSIQTPIRKSRDDTMLVPLSHSRSRSESFTREKQASPSTDMTGHRRAQTDLTTATALAAQGLGVCTTTGTEVVSGTSGVSDQSSHSSPLNEATSSLGTAPEARTYPPPFMSVHRRPWAAATTPQTQAWVPSEERECESECPRSPKTPDSDSGPTTPPSLSLGSMSASAGLGRKHGVGRNESSGCSATGRDEDRAGVDVLDVLEEYDLNLRDIRDQSGEHDENEIADRRDRLRYSYAYEPGLDFDLDMDMDDLEMTLDGGVDAWRRRQELGWSSSEGSGSGSGMTGDGRAARRKRLAKLTRYLGEQVPPELILSSSSPQHTHAHSDPAVLSPISPTAKGSFSQGPQSQASENAALGVGMDQEQDHPAARPVPMRRISVVASKRLLPLSPLSATSTMFPSHPAVAPLSASAHTHHFGGLAPASPLGENGMGTGDAKKVKKQRSFGRLVAMKGEGVDDASYASTNPDAHPQSPPPARHHHQHASSISSILPSSQSQSQHVHSESVSGVGSGTEVANAKKRGMHMGMLGRGIGAIGSIGGLGRDRQLVEDEWTPEAYEDVVSRLRKLK